MDDKKVEVAHARTQIALVDLQIKALHESITRFDAMIDECVKLRRDIESKQVSA